MCHVVPHPKIVAQNLLGKPLNGKIFFVSALPEYWWSGGLPEENILTERLDSLCQSDDESMAKFKVRFTLKQYLPLKPIKRGIKIWQICDRLTGYAYDLNIYCGRKTEQYVGTFVERVVNKLSTDSLHASI